jgi:hypothetical protein
MGKKNWLFIGHPGAGQRSAIIYSIVVSCQRLGKDPLAYLRDVLTRLPAMTNQDDLAALTPHAGNQPLSITHKFAAQRGTEGEAGEMSEAEPHHYIAGCGVSGTSHIAAESGNLYYIIGQGA